MGACKGGYKKAGLMKSAYYDISFGKLLIGYEGDVLFVLKVLNKGEGEGERTPFTDHVFAQVCEYLEGKRQTFDLPFKLDGTAFQQRVWNTLLSVPYGETKTYGEIAAFIGKPGAARAVGIACGKNPLWLVVPCHRVIGAHSLGGYGGGADMKRALIELEQNHSGGSR